MATSTTARTTTIIQNGKLTSKALTTPSRRTLTSADVSNPTALARTLTEMQNSQDAATAAVRSNPHSAPCIVRGVVATTMVVLVIPHTLGRALTGWHIVRQQGAPWAGHELMPTDSGYPVGTDLTKALVLMPLLSGTYDVAITGD